MLFSHDKHTLPDDAEGIGLLLGEHGRVDQSKTKVRQSRSKSRHICNCWTRVLESRQLPPDYGKKIRTGPPKGLQRARGAERAHLLALVHALRHLRAREPPDVVQLVVIAAEVGIVSLPNVRS
eukprot:6214508-Pleurochrysis_carterae.AAC.4